MLMEQLIEKVKQTEKRTIAVASAHDAEVIKAVNSALKLGLANFLLIGDEERIVRFLKKESITPDGKNLQIRHVLNDQESAKASVQAVHNGEADILMKGLIPTHSLLKAVLDPNWGLRGNQLLSHIAVFEIPDFERFLIVTDSGINIHPSLHEKAAIIQNSVAVARSLGIELPRVALLAALEEINLKMEATTEAAILTKMNDRGQIKNCLVDGPLALDNAISLEAAKTKGITGQVAGHADILVVPMIEVGNVLYKSLIYFAHAKVGAIVAGASAPIILTSRSDHAESKLFSLALSIAHSHRETEKPRS